MKRIKDGDEYLVEIDVDSIRATEKARYLTDGDTEFWIPKSQIIDSTIEDGQIISIVIREDIAIEKGLV